MKTNIFLIYKYWKANKLQLVKMTASIVMLSALVLISVLMERTEWRRIFEDMLYGCGSASYSFFDLSDEAYSEMKSDGLVEAIGRIAICGKLGDEYSQYTYGAYIDSQAAELEHLKLSAGRMPEAPGEAALYDYILEDMFLATDPASYIGKEITLSRYGFGEGNEAGEIALKITGIIPAEPERGTKEYTINWRDDAGLLNKKSTPVIYLHPDDCAITEETSTYTMVRLYNGGILTKEQYDISFNQFVLKYNEKYKITPASSHGIESAAQAVANFWVGSEDVCTRIYKSGTMKLIRYFSTVAILISAVSLFGILFSVMPERMKSLSLARRTGCSVKRVAAVIFMEWLFLLAFGIAFGLTSGTALYEAALWVQHHFMGLSPLRGYTAEWAVLQVTDNPFAAAAACTVCMSVLGYAAYFLRLPLRKRRRKTGRVRTLSRILMRLSRNAAVPMQALSLALVLAAAVMCHSFYTMDGKGSGYFTDSELEGEAYYSYGDVDMRDSGTDICIYLEGGNHTYGLAVLSDNGLPAGALDNISKISGIKSTRGYINNLAFNLFYPKGSKDAPAGLSEYYTEIRKEYKMLRPDERDYYSIPAVFGNDEAVEGLSGYVTEGEIGAYENGLTMVFYEEDGVPDYPYSIGDKVNSAALDGSTSNHQCHDMEFVIEAAAVIPEAAREDDPLTYASFDRGFGMVFASPQKTAELLGTYMEKYDKTYITLEGGADMDDTVAQIRKLLDSSMKLKIQTIDECDRAYRSSYNARFASVIVLFIVLVLMAVIGYYSMISMRLKTGGPKIAVLRAAGLSRRRRDRTQRADTQSCIHYPSQLSGGQKRRTFVARAPQNSPSIYFIKLIAFSLCTLLAITPTTGFSSSVHPIAL